jgi:hypothetical protein
MLNFKRAVVAIGAVALLLITWWIASPPLFDKEADEPLMQKETMILDEKNEEEMKTYAGTFMDGVRNYKTSGTVQTVVTGDIIFLRFENFETTNGPDLFVYLVIPDTQTMVRLYQNIKLKDSVFSFCNRTLIGVG